LRFLAVVEIYSIGLVWNGLMKNRGKEKNTGIENECK